jgi:neutral trehalase
LDPYLDPFREGQTSKLGLDGCAPLCTIRTSAILPVELNSILYRNERTLADLHRRRAQTLRRRHPATTEQTLRRGAATTTSGDVATDAATDAAAAAAAAAAAVAGDAAGAAASTAAEAAAAAVAADEAEIAAAEAEMTLASNYTAAAAARRAAMQSWMWAEGLGYWNDVEWASAMPLARESAASYMPLWAGAHDGAQAERAVAALGASTLLQPGGVATTLISTGQQWDWPNAWPPLQQMLVEGLGACGAPGGKALANRLASSWLNSTLLGWTRDGVMYEKMDASRPGERGGGGEYTPQEGFGWSNGVVLWLLAQGYLPGVTRE